MAILKKRILVTSAALLVTVACGTQVGFMLGRALTLKLTENKLKQYATQTMTEADAASLESRAMLAAMRASQRTFCSEDEIASFRNLVFLSEYLKEAGRVRDGRIVCSTMLGRLGEPIALPKPDFAQSDGINVYTKLAPFRVGDLSVITLQQNDAYITFSPYIEAHRVTAPIHYSIMAFNDPHQRTDDLIGTPAKSDILSGETAQQLDDSIHATVCSAQYFNCVTEYIPITDAIAADKSTITIVGVVGGFLGAGFGFLGAWLYCRNRSLEKQLRRAIHKGRMRVVYQPIVDPVTGCAVAAEALARWTNEMGDAVEPEVFVKIAEEHGFIGSLTKVVARQVLHDLGPTLRSHPNFRVSINVTATDLADNKFLPMLEKEIKKARVYPQSVAIEISEGATSKHEVASATIRELRRLGHSVFIDDFGTGYSSLSYLNANTVDAIKIDLSFTQAIGTDTATTGMLTQIVAMAKTLRVQVIVEGIETVEQSNFFSSAECSILFQGWFFGRPVPADTFRNWLTADEKKQLLPPSAPSVAA
jgi:sensor c-di-GMP phosphodiesterase-like protein